MNKWETMVGGAAQYAAVNSSRYLTLDFLSEDAKKSILWACASALTDSYGDDTRMPDPRYLVNFAIPVQYAMRNEHGLASILSPAWVIGFSSEFIGMFIEGLWTRVYRDNEWFDEQHKRNRRTAEYNAKREADELEKARKLLGMDK
jgi:hypothetical protein